MNKIKNYKSKRPAKYLFCYQYELMGGGGGIGSGVTNKYKPADVFKFESDYLQQQKTLGYKRVIVMSITKL